MPGTFPGEYPGPPWFGRKVNGSTVNNMNADRKNVCRFTAGSSMTLRRIWAYHDGFGPGSGTAFIRAVIYAVLAGEASALLATSAEVAIASGAPGLWRPFEFSPFPTVAALDYYLGFICGGTANVARFLAETTGGVRRNNTDTYSDGPSNPFGAPTLSDTFLISVYADDSDTSSLPGAGVGYLYATPSGPDTLTLTEAHVA